MRPLRIGVTTYGRDEDNRFTLPAEYVDSVRRAGATVILLPPGDNSVEAWLDTVDGVILTGGGDIDPELYGGKHHETIYMLDSERDQFELEVTRAVISSGLPTLGICRGTQMINIALGGTLHEHLPDVVGERILHRAPPREPTPHPVQVSHTSRIAKILGATEFAAESWHHQAIKVTAPTLEVVAHAPDGIIEAVEKRDHPWLYAVQWHPELSSERDSIQQRLFDALARAAAELR